MKIEQQTYKSSTLGDIQISFMGRHLMQGLREAIVEAIEQGDWKTNWQALSRARGRIAKYIGELERKQDRFILNDVPTENLIDEIKRRIAG